MTKLPVTHAPDIPPSRRRWSSSDKARILEETMQPGATVLGVARKYGVSAVSIYAWRKAMTAGGSGSSGRGPGDSGARAPLAERRPPSDWTRSGGLMFSDVFTAVQSRPAVAGEDDQPLSIERRLAELEARCRVLQGRIDAWEASRRNMAEVLRTIASQLNLLGHFAEADLPRSEADGA